MNNKVVFNVKASNRVCAKFKNAYPEAQFYGNSALGSKRRSYLFNKDFYLANEETLKRYGNKARRQPYLI